MLHDLSFTLQDIKSFIRLPQCGFLCTMMQLVLHRRPEPELSLQSVCEEDYHMSISVNNHWLLMLKGCGEFLGHHLAVSLALECVVLLCLPPHMRAYMRVCIMHA